MLMRFLITVSVLFFLAACGSTKDTTSSSDTGVISGSITTIPAEYTEGGTQEDLVINVGDRIQFAFDSYDLTNVAQQTLQDQAAWLKQYSDVSITVEGHCDERGTREYNLALGERRAQSMKNYLIGLGVSAGRISTISYGKERPAVLGSNDAAWDQNRRAVAVVN
mgnify:CR=1 FL=1